MGLQGCLQFFRAGGGFQGGDGGGPGPVRVPVNVAAIAQPALVNVQTYSY